MASSIPSTEFASSSSKLPWMYDVLINFTGDDIRNKFVSHLDSALSSVGFTTFLHYHNAVKPMHIQQPILDLCRVAIVVFTKTYSQSAWCLHELQQIIEWHKTYCRHVLPVYYEISPSDVRLQKGDFGKAFEATARQTFSRQQLKHGMSRWGQALTKAANFFGWDESNYRSDAELVDKIVKTVLNLSVLSATKFPVALQPKVEDLIQTIENKSTEVCTIGIYGVGGSGKTTLAKAIYHQIHGTFTEKCFIEADVEDKGLRSCVNLQEQLLSDVLKIKVKIPTEEMGRSMIRERLNGKRVLIVLDDMNDYSLLHLLGGSSCFGEGTVIIITTTVGGMLNINPVDYAFRIKLMNTNESLELLSWHAFREAKPKEEYDYLARRVISCCGGLPLTLEVIGAYLFEMNTNKWETVLFILEKISDDNVTKILKISFDGLHNEMEKDLFLDLCTFFVGKSKVYVTKVLNGCGVDVDWGIRVFMERNLIKLTRNNKFGIHPLVQGMGRKIVAQRGDARYALGETDVFSSERTKILRECPDEKLFLTRKRCIEPFLLRHRPRLLKHAGNPGDLRNSSEFLPYDFYLQDAISIDLRHSLLRLDWKNLQCAPEFQLSQQVKIILVEYGVNITESRISKHCLRSSLVGVGRYNEFLSTVLESSESGDVSLPSDNDPYWLAHIGEGHSVSFTVPQDRVMKGIVLCVVYLSTRGIVTTECFTSVLIVNYTKSTLLMHNHGTVISFNDEDWHGIMSNLGPGDKVEIFVTFGHGLMVKNTTVYLICCESQDLEREPALNKNSLITFFKKIVM